MPPEETIEAAPSEATMVEEPVVAPSEPAVETVVPTEPTEPVAPTEPELYELPDGRKVPGAEVAQEYKNLLSDYTRKSQELAQVKTGTQIEPNPANPLDDPNYIPPTYGALAAQIEAQLEAKAQAKEQERVANQQALEDTVVAQLTEVKTADPTVNENALFAHATKYGFRDLKAAHQNMKDMSDLAKKVQANTVQNIAKRSDPVSSSPGATGAKLNPDDFRSASAYLKALQGQ